MKCDPKAFAKCPDRHICGTLEGATFAPGSYCDKFNQHILRRPVTNADRIRAMSDKELAWFLADKYSKESIYRLNDKGCEPTATQIEAIKHTLYCIWMNWLQQPADKEE